ncbi:nitrilase-related carbon-nitrogen hydrolase [Galbitalea soli]|uniref:Hydrolase n=1 Tax=Galbitalea soli TaxID=1268042 RepID=A0A7C9PNV9_9MICO|nr:nitrilase-related carbon-nitrogen hydrolase [Galbitalea soli]NEM91847.1 hydrolase [Galbitalea soli]NYJ29319.1 putative amidohydrolase [Galbitalea soli]
MVRVAAVQLAPTVGDLAGNLAAARAAISGALEAGADLVVLPELTTSGYVFESQEEARALGIPRDSPVFAEWAELVSARPGALAVVGFAESGEDDLLYNSAAIVGAGGVLGVYRKVHLWDQEKLYFTPGSAAPLVIDTPQGRLGLMICFDLEFPEWTRLAALAGAEILVVPTNWPLFPRPEGERVAEVQIGMATARINKMAVVCADRTGVERGVPWSGGTTIIGADGWVIDSVGEGTGVAWGDIDPADSRDKTLAGLAHAFGDRRTDLYGGVVQEQPRS